MSYYCKDCGGTSSTSTVCENPDCPLMPCCQRSKEMCTCHEEESWTREYGKCLESPWYFFTKYAVVDGKPPVTPLNEEAFNALFYKYVATGYARIKAEEKFKGKSTYEKAKELVIERQQCSPAFLQRHLGVGYMAARLLIDQLADAGVVGYSNGSVAREVLIKK
jgi:hypothetical protein